MVSFETQLRRLSRPTVWTWASTVLVVVFVLGATAVSAIAPVFEAPDEVSHFGYVRSLVVERQLPRLNADSLAENEAGQAPLYYLTAAAAAFWLSEWQSGPQLLPTSKDLNPYASFEPRFRQPPDLDNRNLYAHGEDESIPYRGDVRALHLVRLTSVAFGTLALVATLLTAREVFPSRPPLAFAAGTLLALNPQFIFISAVVNNDSAAAGCASLTLYSLIRPVRRGFSIRSSLFLGSALGLALLAKVSLLGLLPVVGLGFVIAARPLQSGLSDRFRGLILPAAATGAAASLVAGWWYLRNRLLYGDPLAWEAMLVAQRQMTRPEPITVTAAARALFDARDTYWAAFGWTNVLAEPYYYVAADGLVAIALLGMLVAVVRYLRQPPFNTIVGEDRNAEILPAYAVPVLALLGTWSLIVLFALVRWVQTNTAAAQGRLLFPAAGAIALLLSVGLLFPLPRRASVILASLLAPAMLVYAGTALHGTLIPAYRAPPPVAVADNLSIQRLNLSCTCGIEVLGYRYLDLPETPVGEIAVEIYWRVAHRVSSPELRNWNLYVGLFDPADQERARLVTWPGGGRLPTGEVPVGPIYREQVRFGLPPGDEAPGAGQIRLAFFYSERGVVHQANLVTSAGQSIGTLAPLGRFRWPASPVIHEPTNRVDASFAGGPTLNGLDVPPIVKQGELLPVQLFWRAGSPIAHDYTVSVQLLDPAGRLVGQSDAEPREGRYPMSLWRAGEVVVDTHRIMVAEPAPSTLTVLVIVYSLETGERLAITSPPSTSTTGSALEVARVQVAE